MVAPVVVHVLSPGVARAVYRVMAEPPLEFGASHVIVAVVPDTAAVTDSGATGAVADIGVTLSDDAEAGLSPASVVATTTNE